MIFHKPTRKEVTVLPNKKSLVILVLTVLLTACNLPKIGQKTENKNVPQSFPLSGNDTMSSGLEKWSAFFKDENLAALVNDALGKNQELNIVLQEIEISKNESFARRGSYLPSLGLVAGSGLERSARYTRNGVVDANVPIEGSKAIPDPLTDLAIGASLSWEIDIWKKLRNSRKSAVYRYLSTSEGKNFMVTQLISEIANSYYELVALDNQLEILQQNITIQKNALEIVKLEKISAKVTELAVKKFEAEVLKNQSHIYAIQQQITETENHLNFLCGRFPQTIQRNSKNFILLQPDSVKSGVPSQLLQNRADIRQAEMELAAAKLNVKAAKANFYPSFVITANTGFQAFNAAYLIRSPQSLLYNLAGELVAPLINRAAIKAEYKNANARQIQAAFNYEQKILAACIEVSTQLANINNLAKSFEFKQQQVNALTQSIDISTGLFRNARADYMEVLMTQRDALESKFELIETKKEQMHAMVNIYRALGGGWK